MFRKFIPFLKYFFFLGAGLFLVWWQLRSMTAAETDAFLDALRRVDYLFLIPITIMAILSFVSRSMRWKLLMEPLDYHPALSNTFSVTMAGYLANAAVPRLGEVMKCSLLAKYEKLRMDKLLGTILVERAFDLVCYVLFIGLTILMQLGRMNEFLADKLESSGSVSMNTAVRLITGVSFLLLAVYGFRLLLRRYPEKKFSIRLRNIYSGLVEGLKTIRTLKRRKAFLAHTLFIWSMYLLQIYVGFFAMEETAGLPLSAACSVLTLATLAMILTPGGIGSFPVFVMQTLLLYDISQPVGNAFGWLVWGVNTFIIIIFGLASMILLPVINKKANP